MVFNLNNIVAILRCPVCHKSDLSFEQNGNKWAACNFCNANFDVIDGIPTMVKPDLNKMLFDDGHKPDLNRLDEQAIQYANISYHNACAEKYETDLTTYDIFRSKSCQHRIRKTLQEASERSNRGCLLDVCCGTGNILKTAHEYFDDCLGTDISLNMMNVAKRKNYKVLGADATNIPLQDRSVDCVTIFSGLHHIYDYTSAICEMARVLKPGGTFYSDWDPNGHVLQEGWAVTSGVKGLHFLREIFSGEKRIPESQEQTLAECHLYSETGFLPELVSDTLKNAGFSDVRLIYHFNPPSIEQAKHWGVKGWLWAIAKAISFIPPTSRNILPWVAVLGRK